MESVGRDARGRRRWARAVMVGATTAVIVASGASAARPTGRSSGSTVLSAPFFAGGDTSTCLDADTAVCVVSGSSASDGSGAAAASLRPKGRAAMSGRALGQSGPYGTHTIDKAAAAVRYRLVFGRISARASTEGVGVLAATAMLGGYVRHTTCSACTAVVYENVADANAASPEPDTLRGGSHVLELELRNPNGTVPAGRIVVQGLFVGDVGPYVSRYLPFLSAGSASIRGALTRIEVQVLAS